MGAMWRPKNKCEQSATWEMKMIKTCKGAEPHMVETLTLEHELIRTNTSVALHLMEGRDRWCNETKTHYNIPEIKNP